MVLVKRPTFRLIIPRWSGTARPSQPMRTLMKIRVLLIFTVLSFRLFRRRLRTDKRRSGQTFPGARRTRDNRLTFLRSSEFHVIARSFQPVLTFSFSLDLVDPGQPARWFYVWDIDLTGSLSDRLTNRKIFSLSDWTGSPRAPGCWHRNWTLWSKG